MLFRRFWPDFDLLMDFLCYAIYECTIVYPHVLSVVFLLVGTFQYSVFHCLELDPDLPWAACLVAPSHCSYTTLSASQRCPTCPDHQLKSAFCLISKHTPAPEFVEFPSLKQNFQRLLNLLLQTTKSCLSPTFRQQWVQLSKSSVSPRTGVCLWSSLGRVFVQAGSEKCKLSYEWIERLSWWFYEGFRYSRWDSDLTFAVSADSGICLKLTGRPIKLRVNCFAVKALPDFNILCVANWWVVVSHSLTWTFPLVGNVCLSHCLRGTA